MSVIHPVGGLNITKTQLDSYSSKEIAEVYNDGRPSYTDEIIELIVKQFKSSNDSKPIKLALDVGCGSGQFSRILSPYCNQVIGIDPSEAQIAQGKKLSSCSNVEYRLGSSSDLGVADHSVDLITVATAIHRFEDLSAFYAEVERCLRPGGVLAYFAYNFVIDECGGKSPSDNIAIKYLTHKTYLGPYWSTATNALFVDRYNCFKPIYSSNQRFEFEKALPWSTQKFISMMKANEAFNNLRNENAAKSNEMIQNIIDELASAYEPSVLGSNAALDINFELSFNYFGWITQKPSA